MLYLPDDANQGEKYETDPENRCRSCPYRSAALKVLANEQDYDEPFRGSLLYLFLDPGQENTAIRKKYAHLMKYAGTAQYWRVMYSLKGAAIARDYENIHWSRFGGHSWNGIKTIHGRSSWGKLAFEISGDQMRRIKRNLIAKARKAYLQEKRTTHTYHGEVDRWAKDRYAGDPDFYKAKVAPLIRQLDSYLPLVTVGMDDATVDKLFHEAVPGWFEIRFKISELRKDYLEESLFP